MTIESLLAKSQEGFHAGRSFGPAIQGDGCLIIPVAFVAGGGGGGEGHPDESHTRETGFCGGFGTVSWALGVYVGRDGSARFVPAVDATRIVLGVLAAARAVLRLRARRCLT